MPIRSASLAGQIKKNGARLNLAMQSRLHSNAAEQTPSEREQALLEERRSLKEARAKQRAQADLPRAKPKAAWELKLAMTPKVAKAAKDPKAPKAAKEPKQSKTKDHKPTRSEKLSKKAENLEAAKKAAKKSAKT